MNRLNAFQEYTGMFGEDAACVGFPTADGRGGHLLFTWDEVNVILDLVPDATPFFSVEDDEIIKIINEEAFGYYCGQKRVEDVMSIIQNRVQLYVNENI